MGESQKLRELLTEALPTIQGAATLGWVTKDLPVRISAALAEPDGIQWRQGNGGEIYGKNGRVELKQWTASTPDMGIIVREVVPGLFVYELRPRAYTTAEEAKAAALVAATKYVSPGGGPNANNPPIFIGYDP